MITITLFAARHGRGALDQAPRVGDQLATTSLGYTTSYSWSRVN